MGFRRPSVIRPSLLQAAFLGRQYVLSFHFECLGLLSLVALGTPSQDCRVKQSRAIVLKIVYSY